MYVGSSNYSFIALYCGNNNNYAALAANAFVKPTNAVNFTHSYLLYLKEFNSALLGFLLLFLLLILCTLRFIVCNMCAINKDFASLYTCAATVLRPPPIIGANYKYEIFCAGMLTLARGWTANGRNAVQLIFAGL